MVNKLCPKKRKKGGVVSINHLIIITKSSGWLGKYMLLLHCRGPSCSGFVQAHCVEHFRFIFIHTRHRLHIHIIISSQFYYHARCSSPIKFKLIILRLVHIEVNKCCIDNLSNTLLMLAVQYKDFENLPLFFLWQLHRTGQVVWLFG